MMTDLDAGTHAAPHSGIHHLLATLHKMATLAAGRRDLPGWRRMEAAAVADAAARALAALGAGVAADPAQLRIPLPDHSGLASDRLVPAGTIGGW